MKICPKCKKLNDDNWTLATLGDGVCQDCWEENMDACMNPRYPDETKEGE